jgi:hypothetical protein
MSSEEIGFGRRLGFWMVVRSWDSWDFSSSRNLDLGATRVQRGRFHKGGRTDPLPTTALQVSGKTMRTTMKQTPERITRNQKMDLHPKK